MGPDLVVVGHPFCDEAAGVGQPEKQGLIEEFVPHAAVEALAEAVLHRLTRLDIVPRDARILCPGKDCVRGELGAVVRNDHTRLAAGDVPLHVELSAGGIA